jgi:hypothetical protein
MRLLRRHLEPGATHNYLDIGYRRDAVDYAIAGIAKIHDANLDGLGRNPFTSEMEGSMRDYVVETLLQGAYLREYHVWEKDCRAYFAAMAKRNGGSVNLKVKVTRSFPQLIEGVLGAFGVSMPVDITEAIRTMRERVNTMKHADGLELDHFVSEKDYALAIEGLEGFWEHLASCERVTG